MSELRVECLTGTDLGADLPALARLRMRVFREYPYLYLGNPEYEARYLQTYADAPDGLLVVARDGHRVVGASSAMPLAAQPANLIAAFDGLDYDPERIFYYGESVLLPQYRGKGIGRRFFEAREAHVRALGRFDIACFCAVERPDDHPRRPADYHPLDRLWMRQGFVKHPQVRTTFSWRDLDEAEETPKTMVFWLKQLH